MKSSKTINWSNILYHFSRYCFMLYNDHYGTHDAPNPLHHSLLVASYRSPPPTHQRRKTYLMKTHDKQSYNRGVLHHLWEYLMKTHHCSLSDPLPQLFPCRTIEFGEPPFFPNIHYHLKTFLFFSASPKFRTWLF